MSNYSADSHSIATPKRLLRVIGWLMVLIVITLSLIQMPKSPVTIDGGDKLLHLSCYFVLSYWFFHCYLNHKKAIVIGFLALGVGLELLQSLTPFRFFEWLDMLMNAAGVLLAYLTFYCLKIRLHKLLV